MEEKKKSDEEWHVVQDPKKKQLEKIKDLEAETKIFSIFKENLPLKKEIQENIDEQQKITRGVFKKNHDKQMEEEFLDPNLLEYSILFFNKNGDIFQKDNRFFISGSKTFNERVIAVNKFWKEKGVKIDNEAIVNELNALKVQYIPYDERICTEPAAIYDLLSIGIPEGCVATHIEMISDYNPCGTRYKGCEALLNDAFEGALKNKFGKTESFSFRISVADFKLF